MSHMDMYAEKNLPSPSSAFRPRNPGVRRTPPPGQNQARPVQTPGPNATTLNPPVSAEQEQDETMEVEQLVLSQAPPVTPGKDSLVPNQNVNENDESQAGPSQTPRSTRKNRPSSHLPPLPDPAEEGMTEGEIDMETDHGRRWKLTIETMDLATKAASQKWT